MDNLAKKIKKYTYADIIKKDDNSHYEIIDGNLFVMESPSIRHQLLAGELNRQFLNYFFDKRCKVFCAPTDVVISKKKKINEIKTVVIPDLFVVCDLNKIETNYVKGAPDFILEILSPSTTTKDTFHKFNLYGKIGVREYWIVNPKEKVVLPYRLNDKKVFELEKIYDFTEEIPSYIFKELKINIKEFFKQNENLLKEEEEEYEYE